MCFDAPATQSNLAQLLQAYLLGIHYLIACLLSMDWAWDKTIVILINIICGVQLSLLKLRQLIMWKFSPFLNSWPVSKVKQHQIFITQPSFMLFTGGIVKRGTLQKSQFVLWRSARPSSKLTNDIYQPDMENNKAFFEVHCKVIAHTCTKNRIKAP